MEQGKSLSGDGSEATAKHPPRERILCSAFEAFTENGYEATSTLEIARRSKVSKRDLYSLFGSKQAMLVACITARVTGMPPPPDLPAACDRDRLAKVLSALGENLLREICHPQVLAVFRLAIAEAIRSPDVARMLDMEGRQPIRASLRRILEQAQRTGLLPTGDPAEMAGEFNALLWKDLMIGLLLGVVTAPDPAEIARCAGNAVAAFLRLYPEAEKAAGNRGGDRRSCADL